MRYFGDGGMVFRRIRSRARFGDAATDDTGLRDLFSKELHGEIVAYFRPEYVETGAVDIFRVWLRYISDDNLATLRHDVDAILESDL